MNVLFSVPYVPNLVRTRSYNLIRHLSQRGNRVTVLTVWTNEQELADLEALKQECHDVQAMSMPVWRSLWNCLKALPQDVPLQSVYSWHPELAASLNGKGVFDVVHVEHLRGARFGLALKQQTGLPVVWDSVDCISHLFRRAATHAKSLVGRWRARFEVGRTERYEGWLLDKFDRVLVTSQVDKHALAALKANGDPTPPISVLENGVDLTYFSPEAYGPREPATLVVSGKMSYHANATMTVRLMQNIMPIIWKRRPDVMLWIVGKDPGREIRAFANHQAVTVTGCVEDLRPYLRRATIALAPVVYGTGVQNKVLEAMACATPVVSTPEAITALSVTHGDELLVADEPERFAEEVLRLLDEPDRQYRLGQAGLSYVRAHHNWTNIADQLESVYREVEHPQYVRSGIHLGKYPQQESAWNV